jgi:hypothetical protein
MSSPLASTSSRKRAGRRRRKHEASMDRSMPSADPELALNLFADGWLKDPNCVGSSVAELFNSDSEWSSWTTQSLGTQGFEANAPITLDVNEVLSRLQSVVS